MLGVFSRCSFRQASTRWHSFSQVTITCFERLNSTAKQRCTERAQSQRRHGDPRNRQADKRCWLGSAVFPCDATSFGGSSQAWMRDSRCRRWCLRPGRRRSVRARTPGRIPLGQTATASTSADVRGEPRAPGPSAPASAPAPGPATGTGTTDCHFPTH